MPEKQTSDASSPYTYECGACGNRVKADSQPVECPKCGGLMRNISKARE